MKNQYLIFIMIVVLVIAGCGNGGQQSRGNETVIDLPLARGADYTYCIALGYEYEARTDGVNNREYCIFPNGEECISFDFLTGECHREFTLCELQGHTMRVGVEEREDYTATYGICIFSDDSYCKEYDFFKGDCHVKWE